MTVRLQREIDPGLMDNHLKFTEIYVKKMLGQKSFWVKNLGWKFFWVQQILCPKIVGSKKF